MSRNNTPNTEHYITVDEETCDVIVFMPKHVNSMSNELYDTLTSSEYAEFMGKWWLRYYSDKYHGTKNTTLPNPGAVRQQLHIKTRQNFEFKPDGTWVPISDHARHCDPEHWSKQQKGLLRTALEIDVVSYDCRFAFKAAGRQPRLLDTRILNEGLDLANIVVGDSTQRVDPDGEFGRHVYIRVSL